MVTTFVLTFMLAQHGELLVAPPFSEDAAVRLAYMKDSVTPYRIHRTAAGSPPFRLIADPIFRLDNPVTRSRTARSSSGPIPRPAGPRRRSRCSEPPRDTGSTTGRRCRPARSWPRSGPERYGGPGPASRSDPCRRPPLRRQPPRHGSASSEPWPRSSRPPMISWARDGASSGSCRSPGSATARPVRGSRMAPCSPSRSGPTPRCSS